MLGPTLLRARHDEGTAIAAHLATAIAGIIDRAPPETWEAVAESDAAFLEALSAWEVSGSDEDKAKLRTAYRSALAAWRTAIA